MKIKTKKIDFDKVSHLKRAVHKNPVKPNFLLKRLIKFLADGDLKKVNFSSQKIGMEKLDDDEPCLILMNHSSFIDLEIVSELMYPKPYQIVCTTDGFVGKEWLMRHIGCIPTQKFVTDLNLIKDMKYAVNKLNCSILMYPEASYTFDGTATPLPESLGKFVKLLAIPVVFIKTQGAFLRDPLYNMLQIRKTNVSATMEYLLSREDIQNLSTEEINSILSKCFDFDNFKYQQDHEIRISESFRADGLNRVLYKCPHCEKEGQMQGQGTTITCKNCNISYELDEFGFLRAINNESKFNHVPDWFKWERECVRNELLKHKYHMETAVEIGIMVNRKFIAMVGEGILRHTENGFRLTGCNGRLEYVQKPSASYSLYSDYYWYEIGDMICIGDMKTSYYCFPKGTSDIVAKTRLAAEELYKIDRQSKGIK